MFTCIECNHTYRDIEGDYDERMCEECDGTGFEKSPIVIDKSVMGGTKKVVDEFMGYLETIFKDRKGNDNG